MTINLQLKFVNLAFNYHFYVHPQFVITLKFKQVQAYQKVFFENIFDLEYNKIYS